jgi:hypothetical protein
MNIVSLFTKFNQITGNHPIEELLRMIKDGTFAPMIVTLREMVKAGDLVGYAEAKKKLPAFTTSGMFDGGRKMEFIVDYTQILALDIDKLPDEALARIKELVCASHYTFACFVSPSGKGLKILVKVNSELPEHKMAFLKLQSYYRMLTGVEIDPSGKDVTRLCFVSLDEELYHNPSAKVFDALCEEQETQETITRYIRCIALVEKKETFVEGGRNAFVFALALKMRRDGQSEEMTLRLLLRDYCYDEKEVRNSVKSAFGYLWEEKEGENVRQPVPPIQEKLSVDMQNDALVVEAESKPRKREKYNIRKVEELLNAWYETRYNTVTGVIEWKQAGTDQSFVRLEDKHEHTMFRNLHLAKQLIPISTLHIIIHSNFSPDYHPFLSYFKELKPWDGKTDFIGLLADTVKTKDQEYWRFCFRKWIVTMVASMIVDKIINHTIILLVGGQGIGKTTWISSILPPKLKEYLGTAILQADSKDSLIQLAECALIILDELENLNRKDLNSFKELMTRPGIRIRRPYGRNSENLPRRSSILASLNDEQILTDLTGSRRYLCATVTEPIKGNDIDMDLVMAQAYALFLDGFRYWFDLEEIRELKVHNEEYRSKSVEEELVETWMVPVTRADWDRKSQFLGGHNFMLMNASQIAVKLMEKAKIMLNDNAVVKIGKIMKKLGYEKIRKGNSTAYMLRLLDAETVDRGMRTLEESTEVDSRAEEDKPIIRLEEDLGNSGVGDELPF